MAVNRIFGAIYQTGGASGSLDDISASLLKNNDLAVVKDDVLNAINFYRYNNMSSDTEDYPRIIAPDDVVSSGRWFLISPRYFVESLEIDPTRGVITNDIVGNDTGLKLGYSRYGSATQLILNDSGSGLTDGTYPNEPTSGGTGTGLTVDIVVVSGSISSLSINNGGAGYTRNDIITFDNFPGTASSVISSLDNISIDIQQTSVIINTPFVFNENVSFRNSTGAPFDVDGNHTIVDDLNVEFIGGEPVTNISLLDDNTNKYSVLPQVTNPLSVVPSVDSDLVTVKYLNDSLSSGTLIDHGSIGGLSDDDHTQYILTTGDRAGSGFSGTISGIYPILDQHLATKQYVDVEIDNLGLGGGGGALYLLRDGSLSATDVLIYDSSVTYATLNGSDTQSIASLLFVNTKISEHETKIDPHSQYLRNDSDDTTSGRITSTVLTSTSAGNLTTRSEIDDIVIDIFTNTSSADTFTDISSAIFASNIVRKDTPASNRSTYFASTIEQYSENLVTYGYIDARLCNLLQSSNLTPTGKVIEVEIQNGGSGYTAGVNVAVSGGSGSSLTVNIESVSSGVITGVTVNNAGTGYILNETVTVSGGTGGTLTLREVTVGASHSYLYDLDADDHLQYMNLDCSRPLNNTVNFPSVLNSYIFPTAPEHLVTKMYMDNFLSGNSIVASGAVPFYGNQQYGPQYPYDYFYDNNDSNDDSLDLVNKKYIDKYIGKVLISSNDQVFDYLGDSFADNSLTSSPSPIDVINDGSDTCVVIDVLNHSDGEISNIKISNGGSGFVVIDCNDASFPQTRGTGSTTNLPVFDDTGTSTTFTETRISLDEGGNSTADIRIKKIIGDVGFIEIQNAGTGYAVGDVINVSGDGSGARWEVSVIGGSGEITGVQRTSVQTTPYTNAGLVITTTSGSGANLVPYLVGTIIEFCYFDKGTGYIGNEFVYRPSDSTNDGFTWSGEGTTTGDTDDTNIELMFVNSLNEFIEIKHYGSGVLEGNVGVSPLSIDDGDHIVSLAFDDFGHITNVTTDEISIDCGTY